MRIWADVYNAAGQRIGAGPLGKAKNFGVTRALDGAGAITIIAPGTEPRSIDYLRNERQARLWLLPPVMSPGVVPEPREVGRGILREITVRGSSSSWEIAAEGPDTSGGAGGLDGAG